MDERVQAFGAHDIQKPSMVLARACVSCLPGVPCYLAVGSRMLGFWKGSEDGGGTPCVASPLPFPSCLLTYAGDPERSPWP